MSKTEVLLTQAFIQQHLVSQIRLANVRVHRVLGCDIDLPAKLLLDRNATVTICHSRTADLAQVTRNAEILVVAIGRPKFVTADMVSDGTVVIDVGVNRNPEDGKLCGDVDFAAIEPKASVITPVPGGVGPMTIACLMENTIECFLARMGAKA